MEIDAGNNSLDSTKGITSKESVGVVAGNNLCSVSTLLPIVLGHASETRDMYAVLELSPYDSSSPMPSPGRSSSCDPILLCITHIPDVLIPSEVLSFFSSIIPNIRIFRIFKHFLVTSTEKTRFLALILLQDCSIMDLLHRFYNGKAFSLMLQEVCEVKVVRAMSIQTPQLNIPIFNSSSGAGISGLHEMLLSDAAESIYDSSSSHGDEGALTERMCSLCLESLTTNIVVLFCSHNFHIDCLRKIEGSQCPICRYVPSTIAFQHSRSLYF